MARWQVSPVPSHETVSGWGLPLTPSPDAHASLAALARARVATLVARGALIQGGFWHRSLDGVVRVESSLRGSVARVFTGLLVRPAGGCVLRVSRCANRRSAAYDVVETLYADSDRFVPLVIECVPSPDAREVLIEGEIATLGVLPRGGPVDAVELEDRPDIGRAHLDFYDRRYFDQKRGGEVTRKYRRLFASAEVTDVAAPIGAPRTLVVDAGAGSYVTERSARVATAEGVAEAPSPCTVVSFANEVAFTARWDGVRVTIEWDRAALDRRARALEARWRALYPDATDCDGALWYLTKYFTPHPPGEPHFFTKPSAFVVTPAGWSSLVEGVPAEGYDLLRGVVSTDRFHATPAVFAFRAPAEVTVPAGRPLVRVMPLPREMTAPRVVITPFDVAWPP